MENQEIKTVEMNNETENQQETAIVEVKKEGKVKAFIEKAKPVAKKVGKGALVVGAVAIALVTGKALGKREAISSGSDDDAIDGTWEEVPEATEETTEF